MYCTTWTYYGSVGRAASSGLGFVPIFLGPTLVVALWWFVMLKMVRIGKAHRITSIADFIEMCIRDRPRLARPAEDGGLRAKGRDVTGCADRGGLSGADRAAEDELVMTHRRKGVSQVQGCPGGHPGACQEHA